VIRYTGSLMPNAVNFLENMQPQHQRNQLLFNPLCRAPNALERCYYWWQRSGRHGVVEPAIILEINQQLRLVSGEFYWLAQGALGKPCAVEVYTLEPQQSSESLAVDEGDHSLSLEQIEHSRNRFHYAETSIKIKKNDWQLRLHYKDNILQGMATIGQGRNYKTIEYQDTTMSSLARVFDLADRLFS
jgi:hypothetical protein